MPLLVISFMLRSFMFYCLYSIKIHIFTSLFDHTCLKCNEYKNTKAAQKHDKSIVCFFIIINTLSLCKACRRTLLPSSDRRRGWLHWHLSDISSKLAVLFFLNTCHSCIPVILIVVDPFLVCSMMFHGVFIFLVYTSCFGFFKYCLFFPIHFVLFLWLSWG